jgi:hypothetical protein
MNDGSGIEGQMRRGFLAVVELVRFGGAGPVALGWHPSAGGDKIR